MTMRLTVKNEDATRNAVVFTNDVEADVRRQADRKVLAPGESAEFWVHGTRELQIQEGEVVPQPETAPETAQPPTETEPTEPAA